MAGAGRGARGGPVLDVGAGTGRVTLDLARRGHEVVALDADGGAARGAAPSGPAGCPSRRSRPMRASSTWRGGSPLIIVPMQTLQLLGGARGRRGVPARAAAPSGPGGLVALAIADALEGARRRGAEPPLPDMREIDGIVYSSRAVAVADEARRVRDRARPRDRRAGRRGARRGQRRPARRARRRRRSRARAARRAAPCSRGTCPRATSTSARGGDARCLSARCASARSTRSS